MVKLASPTISSSGAWSKSVAPGFPFGFDTEDFFLGDFAFVGDGDREFGLNSASAERVGRNGEDTAPGYEWEVDMVNGGTSPRRDGRAESRSETNATSARFSSSSFKRIWNVINVNIR